MTEDQFEEWKLNLWEKIIELFKTRPGGNVEMKKAIAKESDIIGEGSSPDDALPLKVVFGEEIF